MSKKSITVILPNVKDSEQDPKQTGTTDTTVNTETVDQELEGSELFSLFTANIIKEGKVFTRWHWMKLPAVEG